MSAVNLNFLTPVPTPEIVSDKDSSRKKIILVAISIFALTGLSFGITVAWASISIAIILSGSLLVVSSTVTFIWLKNNKNNPQVLPKIPTPPPQMQAAVVVPEKVISRDAFKDSEDKRLIASLLSTIDHLLSRLPCLQNKIKPELEQLYKTLESKKEQEKQVKKEKQKIAGKQAFTAKCLLPGNAQVKKNKVNAKEHNKVVEEEIANLNKQMTLILEQEQALQSDIAFLEQAIKPLHEQSKKLNEYYESLLKEKRALEEDQNLSKMDFLEKLFIEIDAFFDSIEPTSDPKSKVVFQKIDRENSQKPLETPFGNFKILCQKVENEKWWQSFMQQFEKAESDHRISWKQAKKDEIDTFTVTCKKALKFKFISNPELYFSIPKTAHMHVENLNTANGLTLATVIKMEGAEISYKMLTIPLVGLQLVHHSKALLAKIKPNALLKPFLKLPGIKYNRNTQEVTFAYSSIVID